MKSHCCHRAFTLLELLAVMTLMTMVVAYVVVDMQGISNEGALRAATEQLSSVFRLAISESALTNRPHVVRLGGATCVVRRPVLRDQEWSWQDDTRFDLVHGVTVVDVRTDGAANTTRGSSGYWDVAAGLDSNNTCLYVTLIRNGTSLKAVARVDLSSGDTTLSFDSGNRA